MRSFSFRRRLGWISIAFAVIGLGYMLVDPTARSILQGFLCGERFYLGKRSLLVSFSPRPFPWNWIDRLGRPLGGKQRTDIDKLIEPLLVGDPVPVLI